MSRQQEHPQPSKGSAPQSTKVTPFQRVERHVLRRIVSGFIVLIPLIVTILILRYAFIYVDNIFRGDSGFFTRIIRGGPLDFAGVGVIFSLIVLYLVGLLVSARAGRRAFDWPDAVLSRVPVVKSIYGVAKQAADTLSSSMDRQFHRVVFLEWPRPGVTAMGFVTGHCNSPEEEKTMVVVYIPTVPNPTSGMLAILPEEEVIETGITVEDAMMMVFSGGIVLPDSMQVQTWASLSRLTGDSSVHLPRRPDSSDASRTTRSD